VKPGIRSLPVIILAAVVIALATAGTSFAQVADRKQHMENREKVIDFATRHATLIKGMTKVEVMNIYGRPDKRFNQVTPNGTIEQWTYYFPRRRVVFPWKNSAFSGRFRFLYFKDDILVNFER
jgi:outer membrane protein assembly factor BamE (lipoprotein component of BamABCDE complex)